MTIKDTITEVEKFHNAFGIENNYKPTSVLSEAECASSWVFSYAGAVCIV